METCSGSVWDRGGGRVGRVSSVGAGGVLGFRVEVDFTISTGSCAIAGCATGRSSLLTALFVWHAVNRAKQIKHWLIKRPVFLEHEEAEA